MVHIHTTHQQYNRVQILNEFPTTVTTRRTVCTQGSEADSVGRQLCIVAYASVASVGEHPNSLGRLVAASARQSKRRRVLRSDRHKDHKLQSDHRLQQATWLDRQMQEYEDIRKTQEKTAAAAAAARTNEDN